MDLDREDVGYIIRVDARCEIGVWVHLKRIGMIGWTRTVLGCFHFSVLGVLLPTCYVLAIYKYLITNCYEKTVQMCPGFSMEYLQFAKTEV